jgi:hypothetical protein
MPARFWGPWMCQGPQNVRCGARSGNPGLWAGRSWRQVLSRRCSPSRRNVSSRVRGRQRPPALAAPDRRRRCRSSGLRHAPKPVSLAGERRDRAGVGLARQRPSGAGSPPNADAARSRPRPRSPRGRCPTAITGASGYQRPSRQGESACLRASEVAQGFPWRLAGRSRCHAPGVRSSGSQQGGPGFIRGLPVSDIERSVGQ